MITKKSIIIFVAGSVVGAELFHALSLITSSISSENPSTYALLGIGAILTAFLLWCAYKLS